MEALLVKASAASGYGIWALVLIAVITIVKGWPAIVEASNASNSSLRKDLMARVEGLEEDLRAERKSCDEQIRLLRNEIAGLQRQLIAFQLASGRPLPLDNSQPNPMIDRLVDLLDGGAS